MVAAPLSAPSVVNTRLNYYLEPKDGGTTQIYPGTAGDKLRKHNPQPVQISDMRGHDLTLDRNGFQLVGHESAEKTFDDEQRVKTQVYEETSELLKKVYVGSSRWTWLVRANGIEAPAQREYIHSLTSSVVKPGKPRSMLLANLMKRKSSTS